MVPPEFTAYFTAAVAAAGVLIGLLFVAVSLRPETVFGQGAPPGGRAQAGSAFTALVNRRRGGVGEAESSVFPGRVLPRLELVVDQPSG